ncbi:hypothetical protein NNC19_18680 [Clostridium sp. SHJSY1]|uniref:hypothetical protein n=1 Tax=Clostridium sp. SHJSY1 TaxID=2942483 RepID=UPI0028753AC0|nr:hypothetical protein [Clostridium sp. SHJSY1]MDS0527719.1 hypothetical protein [Clostridium sp. SHJSY1]
MKKSFFAFLILLILSFNIMGATNPITSNVFKEGIYNLSDFEAILKDKIYKVQNVSTDKNAYVIIFDDNLKTLQSIILTPQSIKYDVTPLKSSYKVVIVGNGEVYFS